MAQNDIRRLSVGNGRIIELKESAGALYARETSEWGFEEVFDLTTLPGYDAGRRATYRINAGNIERREAQEPVWEVVMAVGDLALTPVEAGGGDGGGMTLVYAASVAGAGSATNEFGLPGAWSKQDTGWYRFSATDTEIDFTEGSHLFLGSQRSDEENGTVTIEPRADNTFDIRTTSSAGSLADRSFYISVYAFPPAE